MKIEITNMDHLGRGIGKINNKIVFVPKSITGDVLEIEIVKNYKNYDIGRIKKIIIPSMDRVNSKCIYYDKCGGCNLSNHSYDKQLLFKENKVKNIFKKYLNLEIEPKVIDSDKQFEYRNKITFRNDKVLGLVSEFDDIIAINKCLLVSDKVNELYNLIKKEDITKVKKIMIRECDNGLILDIDGEINTDNLLDKCIAIYMNNKLVSKKEDGYINIGKFKYIVSNKSFFQINTGNISKLYDEIINYGNFKKDDLVIDLYCGVGSISLYIAKYVKQVLGIEIVKEAIDDARKNAKINKIDNVKFLCGDVSKLIDDNINGDVLIVDPPRIGLGKHTVNVINEKKIKKIIYVSCDAMTLVRDINLLTNYEVSKVSVVDMFPQTHHCESIVLLSLKK